MNFKQIAKFTWICDKRILLCLTKIKLVKGRGFDFYKTTEKKKEHNQDTVFTETGDDDVEFIEDGEGKRHITHVNNNQCSIFSNAVLYTNNHQFDKSNGI